MAIKSNGFRDAGESSQFVLSCGVVLVCISEDICADAKVTLSTN